MSYSEWLGGVVNGVMYDAEYGEESGQGEEPARCLSAA